MRETLRRLHALAEAGTPAIGRCVATHRLPLVSEQGVTFLNCGAADAVPLLQQHGMQVRHVEAPDGRNRENWRYRLRDALSWLFPGPLWMVYE